MYRNESSISFNRQSESLPGDFALLPIEVAYDVVDSADTSKMGTYCKLRNLSKIEGSWGEVARKLSACTWLANRVSASSAIFCSRAYDRAVGIDKEIPFEEARNRDICHSFIDERVELDQLTAVAPKLYDNISFNAVPHTLCNVLDLIGTRFARITWRGEDSKKPATPELVNFLRRQLLSNYLRELEVSGVKIEDGVLNDHLVVFVARPFFKTLYTLACHVPFEVIESTHRVWEAPKCYQFNERVITAHISKETLGKIEEYFEKKFEFENEARKSQLKVFHPEESDGSICLSVQENIDHCWMQMKICDL